MVSFDEMLSKVETLFDDNKMKIINDLIMIQNNEKLNLIQKQLSEKNIFELTQSQIVQLSKPEETQAAQCLLNKQNNELKILQVKHDKEWQTASTNYNNKILKKIIAIQEHKTDSKRDSVNNKRAEGTIIDIYDNKKISDSGFLGMQQMNDSPHNFSLILLSLKDSVNQITEEQHKDKRLKENYKRKKIE